MKQFEAVIKVMEENGGYATLGKLYVEVFKIPSCTWKTKTPFATIRRIVQDQRFFFKIKPGLWALNTCADKIPKEIFSHKQTQKKDEDYSHSYYQGLLVEIGNLKQYETFIPAQDKNKLFLRNRLGEVATLSTLFDFSYHNIIRYAKTIDVSWFNERKMPSYFFEVEHSTDIRSSLSKFTELQDFYCNFYIVADAKRKTEFHDKIALSAFSAIQRRTQFMTYDQLSEWHTKTYEIVAIENSIGVLSTAIRAS